jgi:hypothetical protein
MAIQKMKYPGTYELLKMKGINYSIIKGIQNFNPGTHELLKLKGIHYSIIKGMQNFNPEITQNFHSTNALGLPLFALRCIQVF